MSKLDLSKYGITGTTEIVHNPSYELLFEEETKAGLEGFEKGQVTELDAVNVMNLHGTLPERQVHRHGRELQGYGLVDLR